MSLGGVLLFALFSLSKAQGTYVIYKSLSIGEMQLLVYQNSMNDNWLCQRLCHILIVIVIIALMV